ncbi:hypothetical protein [Streptomyces sp. MBT27]|uniref:hypothetical protein n=1 Tax=Streptomyces sp. MBT27 TaxID=1488356 RepID=UPI0014243968|nr:hypothetical protein [Streptomyces sp. MBT27]
MTRTALNAIAAFLRHLEDKDFAFETRRVRGSFLTEYLEHAQNAETAPAALLGAEELMELPRAHAWLEDAAAGRTRRRNTLSGPGAPSADATNRVRIITYNVFAEYLRTPWRLEVPPNASGEHLDPDEADQVVRRLAAERRGATAAVALRTAAMAALVAETGRTVAQLATLYTEDVQLHHTPPRILLSADLVHPLSPDTARVLDRWMRQRAGIITTSLQGTDPGHLWIPTQPGRPRDDTTPLGLDPAAVRTLHSAHRRLVLDLLGRSVRPGALRPR